MIEGIQNFTEYLEECATMARRMRRRLIVQLVICTIGAITTTGITARNIEQGAPWWLTTIGAIITAAWAIEAASTRQRLRAATESAAELVRARATLDDAGLLDFLKIFASPRPTSTTQDEDPDVDTPRA